MTYLYNLYAFDYKRFCRLGLLLALPGIITILCHAGSTVDVYPRVIDAFSYHMIDPTMSDRIDGDLYAIPREMSGPPPRATNDIGSTAEETPFTIDVLANDRRGGGHGNDDDDDGEIDRETVDLNPMQSGIQSSLTSSQGTYTVDEGKVAFIPALDFFGNATIQYTVASKGNETSNVATLTITVNNVNDAPVIVSSRGGIDVRAGQPVTLTMNDVTIVDPDNQPPTDFSITVLSGENYAVSGNTITPSLDFSGALPVAIQVGDGAALSSPFSVTLNVSKKNETPSITGQASLTTPEDQPITITTDHLVVSDADDSYPTGFTIKLGEGANYSVSGLTVTPAPNYAGSLSVSAVVNDGETDSAPYPLQITVMEVNDKPVITGQQSAPITTAAGQSLTIVLENLLVSDPDHVYPNGFSLAVLPGDNYTASGTTITPASGFSGTLLVNVAVNDGVDSSVPYPVQVVVASNTPPVVTGQSELITNEETPLAVTLSNITVSDPDNAYPTGFTFRLLSGNDYSVAGDIITPALNFAGLLSVPVVVNDGMADSEPFALQITVAGINDRPVITGQVALTVPENQSLTLTLGQLTVVDPDNEYPGVFTLSVSGGAGYSVTGNVITPAAGFNGTLTIPVSVNDGTAFSEPFNLSVSVTPTNDPPVITGQRALQINEDTPVTLSLQDLTVSDPDNTFPEGFSLAVEPGTNYTVSGMVVTPAVNFTGELSVNVSVSDGLNSSGTFPLKITVLPQNDAPVISGHNAVTTNEDVAREITLNDLIVSDPDNAYPSGFTLLVSPGVNYTLSGNTITPSPNFFGTLNVQVQVNDGLIGSNILSLPVQVVAVNDAPVITGQVPVQTAEDTPVTLQLANLTVLDVDNSYPSGFTLIVSAGSNYTASGSTVTPLRDFNGTINVNVTVNDGTASSAPFNFQIQVGDSNDPPAITGQTALVTNEEQPITIALSNLTVFDPDNAFPTGFSLLVSPGNNYSVSGQAITPLVNFAGILTIPVRVNDGINNSASFDLKVQVNQINDPPSFAAIPNQQVAENSPVRTVTISGISKGPLEDYQQLTFVATSGNTAIIEDPLVVYNGTGATAVLSYVVKPNASGLVTINVVAIDNGSNTPPNENRYAASFQVDVLEVNTAPTINAITDITIQEDAEQQNIALAGISAGAGETQSLNVVVTSNKPDFFELLEVAYTSAEPTGLLQFKTKPNVSGTAQLSVSVIDNGSGVSPNVNRITRVFSVVVQPVNDPPVFESQAPTVAAVNESYEYKIIARDPDGDALTFSAPVKPDWISLTGSNNGRATLTGRPPAGALGNANVTIQVKDAAAMVSQSFTIYVNVRPVVAGLSIAVEEDAALQFSASLFTGGYTDGNENALNAVQIASLPGFGSLTLAGAKVEAGDTITTALLAALTYMPNANYFGSDSFTWKAFDGYHFSIAPASVNISVLSVNDPPEIVFLNDTLHYEVNGEAAFLSSLTDIVDPDDDTLARATIVFHSRNYRPEFDVFEFQNTPNIRGNFNIQSGALEFSGVASISEYRTALRSIQYLHQNTLDPVLEPKVASFTLYDADGPGPVRDKVIMLQYTFVEFEIPSGFTPNGDNMNDTWLIDRPGGGLEEMKDAVISIYNKRGVLVYRRRGFDQAWDGTMNGELLPADSYFFTIDLQLRNKKTYKGIVTILR